MSKGLRVCGDKDLHIGECSECEDYESRISALEECCEDVHEELDGKQDTLVSGINIKTINHQTLLGSGNIDVGGGGSGDTVSYTQTQTTGNELGTITINGNSQKIYGVDYSSKQDQLVSGTTIKTINGETVLGSGNIVTPDTDTHYTGYVRAGASGGTTNAATTDPYLNYVEDGQNRSGVRLIGGANVDISSDANGNVTIDATGGGGGGDAVSYAQTLTSGTESGKLTINGVTQSIYSPSLKTINGQSITGTGNIITPDNDTHYTGYLRAGTSSSTTNTSATDPYLNYVENGSLRSGVRLYGGSNVTISSNGYGTVTISSTGGGDTVSYTQTQTTGDTLGSITINGSSKNIYGQAKLVSGTNIKTINGNSILGSGNLPLLKRTTDYVDNLTVSANTDYFVDFSIYVPSGYTKIGVIGWDISNASSSGTNASHCAIRSIFPTSSENIRVEIGNFGTATAKLKITLYILFVYGTLY